MSSLLPSQLLSLASRFALTLSLVLGGLPVGAIGWTGERPKLVVVLVIDQFRSDYMSKFRHEFRKDGFLALTNDGAFYPVAEYEIMQSMTGPGHAVIMSGALPYQMGIPLNEWYSQKTRAPEYCVEDFNVQVVDTRAGIPKREAKDTYNRSSPKNFYGSSVGDELKNMGLKSRVVTVAQKDRSAVLMGGKRADLAFWLDRGGWVSSTYYRPDGKLPAWLEKLTQSLPADKDCNWKGPCGVEQTARAAIAALMNERLGQGPAPDILAVSFSGHDMLGHHSGTDTPEMRLMTLAEDKAVAEIRKAVARSVPGGLKNVVFVLTGDHGVAPVPEEVRPLGMDAGRIDELALLKKLNADLNSRIGKPKQGEWIAHVADFNFYIDEHNARAAKKELKQLENWMKAALLKEDNFAFVFTRSDFEAGLVPPRDVGRRVQNTYFPGRSGHVVGIVRPFYIDAGKHKANHVSSYTYDRTVPLILSGFGVRKGLYAEKAHITDIAPTLSFILGVLPPALNDGRVLHEALLLKAR